MDKPKASPIKDAMRMAIEAFFLVSGLMELIICHCRLFVFALKHIIVMYEDRFGCFAKYA